jgi:hypothetical protein
MMGMEKHIADFIKALNGGRRALDEWLECNNEQECRDAMLGAIQKAGEVMRERCAVLIGEEWDEAGAAYEIRALPGVTFEDLNA